MAGPASPTSQLWPELYGFWIYGNGPTYVIYVEPTSISETAGIRVGDRIIELDNQDVSNLSAGVIKFMARNSKHTPPPISVQSHAIEVEVAPDHGRLLGSGGSGSGYGFTIAGDMPVLVDKCAEGGAGYLAGLRPGDVVVECNGKPVRYAESLRPLLASGSSSKLLIKYIPLSREPARPVRPGGGAGSVGAKSPTAFERAELEDVKFKRAQNFYSLLNQVFYSEPEKRKFIINELKAYTETGDIYKLASNINAVLKTPQQRQLLDEIRPFIPGRHQALFESLTVALPPPTAQGHAAGALSYQEMAGLFDLANSGGGPSSGAHGYQKHAKSTQTRSAHAKSVRMASTRGRRRIVVKRSPSESFGFKLRGHKPVVVEHVESGSPADVAGIRPNDVILAINDMEVEDKTHHYLYDLLQSVGTSPVIEVMSKADYEAEASNNAFAAAADVGFDLRNPEGKTFKQKVKDVLNPREKPILKKILLDYNSNKDIDSFLKSANKLLDTPAKKSLWFFLMPILEEDHQDYVRKVLHLDYQPEDYMMLNMPANSASMASLPTSAKQKRLDASATAKQPSYMTIASAGLQKGKHYGSAPSVMAESQAAGQSDSDLVFKFSKQLDYLLNPKERNEVKNALRCYNQDRNIYTFIDAIDHLLDTPAKRTLWFHIIPLLDEDDQEYCKRKISLATLISRRDSPVSSLMMRASPSRFMAAAAAAEAPVMDFERRERREQDRDHEFYSLSEHYVQSKPTARRPCAATAASEYDPSYAVIESVVDGGGGGGGCAPGSGMHYQYQRAQTEDLRPGQYQYGSGYGNDTYGIDRPSYNNDWSSAYEVNVAARQSMRGPVAGAGVGGGEYPTMTTMTTARSRPAHHYRSNPNLAREPAVSSKTADAMGLRHRYLAEATTISTTHQQERVREFSYERRESPSRLGQWNSATTTAAAAAERRLREIPITYQPMPAPAQVRSRRSSPPQTSQPAPPSSLSSAQVQMQAQTQLLQSTKTPRSSHQLSATIEHQLKNLKISPTTSVEIQSQQTIRHSPLPSHHFQHHQHQHHHASNESSQQQQKQQSPRL